MTDLPMMRSSSIRNLALIANVGPCGVKDHEVPLLYDTVKLWPRCAQLFNADKAVTSSVSSFLFNLFESGRHASNIPSHRSHHPLSPHHCSSSSCTSSRSNPSGRRMQRRLFHLGGLVSSLRDRIRKIRQWQPLHLHTSTCYATSNGIAYYAEYGCTTLWDITVTGLKLKEK